MKVNSIFQQFTKRKFGSGKKALFWEDVCIDDSSLADRFSRLYSICFTMRVTVDFVKK